MAPKQWVQIAKVHSNGEAEIIRGMLEAQEIETLLAQEGAAKALGLSIGSLGEIQIHVKADDEDLAREIVQNFFDAE